MCRVENRVSFLSSAPVALWLPLCRLADEHHHLVENSRLELVVLAVCLSRGDVCRVVCSQPLVLDRSLSPTLPDTHIKINCF